MKGSLVTAGQTVAFDVEPAWLARVIEGCADGHLLPGVHIDPSMAVTAESSSAPFDVDGWERHGRDMWRRGSDVVIVDVSTSGLDLMASFGDGVAEFRFRARPSLRTRIANGALRTRALLLQRQVLAQYPAMWWAGVKGAAPLHAPACATGDVVPLVVGPSAVGKTSLVMREVARGGRATSDNISVSDGRTVWGVVEPMRSADGSGRRMTYGRREHPLANRASSLAPDRVVVLTPGADVSIAPCSPEHAARVLTTSTYTAGELRRYWTFASMLAAGSGLGPAHPQVAAVSDDLCASLPCFEVIVGDPPHASLLELLASQELRSWI